MLRFFGMRLFVFLCPPHLKEFDPNEYIGVESLAELIRKEGISEVGVGLSAVVLS